MKATKIIYYTTTGLVSLMKRSGVIDSRDRNMNKGLDVGWF